MLILVFSTVLQCNTAITARQCLCTLTSAAWFLGICWAGHFIAIAIAVSVPARPFLHLPLFFCSVDA